MSLVNETFENIMAAADLTLCPAPGEKIELNLTSLDQMLNYVPMTIALQVNNGFVNKAVIPC